VVLVECEQQEHMDESERRAFYAQVSISGKK
jgi:hypothetical protein